MAEGCPKSLSVPHSPLPALQYFQAQYLTFISLLLRGAGTVCALVPKRCSPAVCWMSEFAPVPLSNPYVCRNLLKLALGCCRD